MRLDLYDELPIENRVKLMDYTRQKAEEAEQKGDCENAQELRDIVVELGYKILKEDITHEQLVDMHTAAKEGGELGKHIQKLIERLKNDGITLKTTYESREEWWLLPN